MRFLFDFALRTKSWSGKEVGPFLPVLALIHTSASFWTALLPLSLVIFLGWNKARLGDFYVKKVTALSLDYYGVIHLYSVVSETFEADHNPPNGMSCVWAPVFSTWVAPLFGFALVGIMFICSKHAARNFLALIPGSGRRVYIIPSESSADRGHWRAHIDGGGDYELFKNTTETETRPVEARNPRNLPNLTFFNRYSSSMSCLVFPPFFSFLQRDRYFIMSAFLWAGRFAISETFPMNFFNFE